MLCWLRSCDPVAIMCRGSDGGVAPAVLPTIHFSVGGSCLTCVSVVTITLMMFKLAISLGTILLSDRSSKGVQATKADDAPCISGYKTGADPGGVKWGASHPPHLSTSTYKQ